MTTIHRLGMLVLTLVLSGCAVKPVEEVKPVVPEKQTVSVAPELLRRCVYPPALESRRYSEADVVSLLGKWLGLFDQCSNKQESLAGTIRKAFNLEVPEK